MPLRRLSCARRRGRRRRRGGRLARSEETEGVAAVRRAAAQLNVYGAVVLLLQAVECWGPRQAPLER